MAAPSKVHTGFGEGILKPAAATRWRASDGPLSTCQDCHFGLGPLDSGDRYYYCGYISNLRDA